MSIYKNQQTDGSGNWFLHLFAYLFSLPCRSHVDDYEPTPLRCSLVSRHKGKHYDSRRKLHWCYGDEYFEE